MLTPQQKLNLFRKAGDNPGAAFLEALELMSKQMEIRVDAAVKDARQEVEEKLLKIEGSLSKKVPDLVEVLDSIKGMDGDDADPEEVAKILLETPEFIQLTKGEKGDTIKGDTYVLTEEDKQKIASATAPVAASLVEIPQVVHTKTVVEKPIVTQIIKEKAVTDKPIEIASKLNTLTEKVEKNVIIGLTDEIKKIWAEIRESRRIKKGGGSGGGGMGNIQHEEFSTSSATTTVTTAYKVAGNGTALWVYYNGQFLMKGTHYTVSAASKTITFLFTLQDSTKISVTYIRG